MQMFLLNNISVYQALVQTEYQRIAVDHVKHFTDLIKFVIILLLIHFKENNLNVSRF